jgi:hypothetical protein
MSNKKKRALTLKNRQKLLEKNTPLPTNVDGKLPISISNEEMKEVVITSKSKLDENIKDSNLSSTADVIIPPDLRQLPADIRLNMLTGVPNSNTSHSLASINSIGEKSKDAISRMNELIRENSFQNIHEELNDDEQQQQQQRKQSIDINPIEYYINETNKLTSDLESSIQEKSIEKDENNMKQVNYGLSFTLEEHGCLHCILFDDFCYILVLILPSEVILRPVPKTYQSRNIYRAL